MPLPMYSAAMAIISFPFSWHMSSVCLFRMNRMIPFSGSTWQGQWSTSCMFLQQIPSPALPLWLPSSPRSCIHCTASGPPTVYAVSCTCLLVNVVSAFMGPEHYLLPNMLHRINQRLNGKTRKVTAIPVKQSLMLCM